MGANFAALGNAALAAVRWGGGGLEAMVRFHVKFLNCQAEVIAEENKSDMPHPLIHSPLRPMRESFRQRPLGCGRFDFTEPSSSALNSPNLTMMPAKTPCLVREIVTG